MVVEGAVKRKESFVAANETFFWYVPQQGAVALDRIEFRLLAKCSGIFCGNQLDRKRFVGHGNKPVLKRTRLESDPAVRIELKMLASLGSGLAKASSFGQRGIELADVLRGGDDIDAVAHAKDCGNALVDDRLSKRSDGANLVVNTLD